MSGEDGKQEPKDAPEQAKLLDEKRSKKNKKAAKADKSTRGAKAAKETPSVAITSMTTAAAEEVTQHKAEQKGKDGTKDKNRAKASPPTLELVREARLADLLVEVMDGQYEASGVHYHRDRLYIVFDNYPNIACLTPELTAPPQGEVLIRQRGERIGFEDITYHESQRRWYCLIEATEYEPDLYHSRIEEYDETFRFIESLELNFKIKGSNKGIEGLSHLHYKGEDYLLALCEGNACKSGSAGREGGKGRILLFQRGVRRWEHVGTIKLPKSVEFADYSSLDLRDGRIAVVSQESSAVWVATLKAEPAGLDDLWEGDGRILLFPRDKKGRVVYCNMEGISLLGENRVIVVSDRAKPGKQPGHCAGRDQSIHIFSIPAE